ncbi:MFS transporter [Actinomadura flavalba]|uniref:MFS transporter n=1 Tax=Actinomadura flavalba TaxID=1120938 RepID=UPI000367F576|nr:MFS transporter [Actinomadura flavalba]
MTMTETPTRAPARAWAGLAVLALPTLLLALDNTVLYLALPHLTADLRPGPVQQLWIMDVYGFMMAGFLVTMGGVGDRIGRRRLLMIGAVAFGLSSALAAWSVTPEMLLAARVLLGISGATLMPSALALIGTMFTDPAQRGIAVGTFVACFMGGAALGPVIGGALLQSFWWGSVFLLGVPVMVVLLVAAPLLLPEHRGAEGGRLDPVSVALSLAAILPVVYGLKELAGDPVRVVPYVSLAAGAAFGAAFLSRQRRLASPLLDPALFRSRALTSALAILLGTMVAQGGVYLLVSQYLQNVAGMAPLRAGFTLVPPALALVAGSLGAPVLARKVRPSTVIGGGLLLATAGFTFAALSGSTFELMAGLVVGYLGTAPVGALGMGMVLGAAPAGKAGSASAVAETSGEFGIGLGIAVFGSLGAVLYRLALGDAPAAARDSVTGAVRSGDPALADRARDAFTTAVTTAYGVTAVLAVLLAVLAFALLRHVRPAEG